MKIQCTEDEFRRVISEIQRYLTNHPKYSRLVVTENNRWLGDVNEPEAIRRELGWQTLYEEIENGITTNIEDEVKFLKRNFTDQQLKKIKDLL